MRFYEMNNENMMDGKRKSFPFPSRNWTLNWKHCKYYKSKAVFENFFLCNRSFISANIYTDAKSITEKTKTAIAIVVASLVPNINESS